MATILAYTSPAFGNLYPIIALLIDLQRRGHRIVLRTLADGVSTGNAGIAPISWPCDVTSTSRASRPGIGEAFGLVT